MAVKVFRSFDADAPELTGEAGSLLTVLDAVLLNGYNTVSVSSLTRSSSTVTVTTSSAHGFATGEYANISGADQSDYNGDFVVTVTSSTEFTYSVSSSQATTGTGTIEVKRAPLNWANPYTGTNQSVYRSSDPASNQFYLRVDDTGGTGFGPREARIAAYESMTAVDTGTDRFPSVAQYPDGFYAMKSSSADATARGWVVIGDEKRFYMFLYFDDGSTETEVSDPSNDASGIFFGDAIPFKPSDPYITAITGEPSSSASSSQYTGLGYTVTSGTGTFDVSSAGTSNGVFAFARDYTGTVRSSLSQLYASGRSYPLGSDSALDFPHGPDNGFYITPCHMVQENPSIIRARLPGAFESLHGKFFANLGTITNVSGYSGRTFMQLYATTVGNDQFGIILDTTGPWE